MTKHFNKREEKRKRRMLRSTSTYCEQIMWLHLRNRKLQGVKFRRQYSIDEYVIDFYAPELKLAVELDGDIHEEVKQKKHDVKRQSYLEGFGIEFLRFKNEELLGNPNLVFKRIEEEIIRLRREKM